MAVITAHNRYIRCGGTSAAARHRPAAASAAVDRGRQHVNDGLKLVENQRYEIDGLSGLSGEICERISPSIFWWQTTSGGNSLSRPQPPEAVAEGQSLQGIAPDEARATEIDVRRAIATTAIQPITPALASSARQGSPKTVNFKSVVFDGFPAVGDRT